MIWLSMLGRQVWGWVALVAGALVAAFVLYQKGHKDARTAQELQTLENEVATRRTSDEVRSSVSSADADAVAERLRRGWTRPGS